MDDLDYYKYALGIAYAIPSADTLRQRFGKFESNKLVLELAMISYNILRIVESLTSDV